ncbi:MAG TPA: MerR family transcriptional regulator [Terriglobales bacterium]|nr:MerR family transcriptional regulator [Terriglobales bacterium]
MLTVSKLAQRCGLSRTTVLYYESIGLLAPALRSGSNYRTYSEHDLERLRQICAYREAGLKLSDIRSLLDRGNSDATSILRRRLLELDAEIEALREHQRAILRLLQTDESLWRTEVITKDKWVSIMRAAGFTEDDMHRWHKQFERDAPQEHQEFLEFLHIDGNEIRSIRDWSRKG